MESTHPITTTITKNEEIQPPERQLFPEKPKLVVLEHQMTVNGHDLYERREVEIHMNENQEITNMNCQYTRTIDNRIFNVIENLSKSNQVEDREVGVKQHVAAG